MREGSQQKAWLILEDGTVVEGAHFGASGTGYGELVFNTGMTGYQESLTDPSYHGQVLMFTYPMVGNYGISPKDWESARVWPRAVVVREWCAQPSHRDSTMTLDELLRQQNVPGITGVDTRALTLKTREKGCLRCFVTDDQAAVPSLVAKIHTMASVEDDNLAGQASTDKLQRHGLNLAGELNQPFGDGPIIAVLDTGIKLNILRNLARRFNVLHFPWNATADEISWHQPDGLFLANGPGDPAHADIEACTIPTISKLAISLPIFGICYGNQLIARAFGAKTYKMKFGHRGANVPTRDEITGVVRITSQNHGFAVDGDSVAGTGLMVWERCPNDGTVEALRHETLPIFTTQYHPEAAPGPWDSNHMFDAFYALVETCKAGRWQAGKFPTIKGAH